MIQQKKNYFQRHQMLFYLEHFEKLD